MATVGIPIRVYGFAGEDLGIAEVPPPVRIGDLIAIEDNVFQICAVVETTDTAAVAAIVSVRPVKLPG